ncbi:MULTISPECIES: acyl-CoA dehydrogenase family protein [unclassified Cryobacterium]|uniref:acyl-CoA dehydrogenase family protein n=1 Tax=unclassified Cryobacterium TaxID=2649013 RepID=UPI00106978DD|nr:MULTISPECIES: acyl-CoA dehydrogenase family protein [unclassified Cryobacterium]TFB98263.1 acyl-CoA dehydrogenase [Cryobacterium sp. MDB2-A-1]TFC06130.1 acyl-CoA dehydrogenase [Cryobacterium sp. MDB2-33-2]TFC13686.1 acyl-CoA dehydrogenase [Cryobacterium sp. MDB2-A-2]TFC23752.1 acyl-CoA dehydrogenase [Cryobacterium sp. MDB2-10]
MTASGRPTPLVASPLVDSVFDLDDLLAPEEVVWSRKARAFATNRILPTIEQDFEDRFFRAELVPELGAAGFLGMHLEGYGCAGASAVSYGLVCLELEAADSGWRTLVSVQGSLAMSAIHKYGTEDQKQRWLPGMAAGSLIGCFALTEPTGGSDPAAMRTTARRDGGDWVLTGTKRWIGLASVADVAVVWAQTDAGVRGFLVPTGTAGFTATPIAGKLSMRASIQCDVTLDGVRLPADAVLPGATGLSGPFSCLNEARFGIVWGSMGAARSCLDAAIARSRSREVFGRPIGAMQLTQAKLADMLVEYEKGVLLALHLGRLKERGTLSPAQISVGKLNSVREAIRIAGLARSILGGDGVTNEFPVMRHLANLESVRTYEGTDEIHQLVIGRALTGMPAF